MWRGSVPVWLVFYVLFLFMLAVGVRDAIDYYTAQRHEERRAHIKELMKKHGTDLAYSCKRGSKTGFCFTDAQGRECKLE